MGTEKGTTPASSLEFEKGTTPATFLEFEKRLNHLLEIRLELVPFHVCNVGPLACSIKRWELLSVFSLLSPEKQDSILCVEDTLGILSYLLLPFCEVTYNSSPDKWDFAEKPHARIIGRLSHLPPKHELFSESKFSAVLLPSLLDAVPPRRDSVMSAACKLLAPGGCIIASFTTCGYAGQEHHGCKQRMAPDSWKELLRNFRLRVESSKQLPTELADGVAGSMCVVRLVRR